MVSVERKELARLFSEFWGIPEADVLDSLRLDDETLENRSSVRFYRFIAAVESNFNVTVKDVNKILTFKDLLERAQ